MKISLIIPAYNEEKYIGACLESVAKNGAGLFEVIVINNASTDNTKQIAESFVPKIPNLRVIDELKKGLPFARNRGLSESHGEIVAYIDADAHMPAGWIKEIERQFGNNPKLVCLSGPYRFYDGSILIKIGVWLYDTFLVWPSYFFTRSVAIAGNFVARKNIFVEIGGFNESIAFYGDDTDIVRRLTKKGKAKFSGKFFMYTSARRLKGQGILKTAYHYAVNFLAIVFIQKPFTEDHRDIR